MEKIISDLKKNPVYSMSLGGKELFHSNMLAWLLMSEDNQSIKQLFGIEKNEVVLNVFREHQNLDLLIVYSSEEVKKRIGDISILDDPDSELSTNIDLNFIIIENKYKSIPKKQQLEEYSDKLNNGKYKVFKTKLTNKNTRCYLLAPKIVLKNALGFENNEGFLKFREINGITWTPINYKDFKDKIISKNHPNEYILKDYCDMLSALDIILDEYLRDDIDNNLVFPNAENIKLLKQIRFYDIYTKLWYGITQKKIEEAFENKVAFNRKDFGMTRSIGFFEWKIEYEEKLLVGVQIQGNQFRVFVEPYYKKKPKDSNKFIASVNDNSEFKKNICGWGSNIINEAFSAAEIAPLNVDEYKYLKFADFKYVKRELDSNMTIEKLASIVSNALKMLNDENKIKGLYNDISSKIERN
ncbi:MAG: PD-(D/E)XK nuclease family protein [Spirochaetales bacterium]|nr:PD-(D/E)XK nuclease family protein [Spirochaetales bacterium]